MIAATSTLIVFPTACRLYVRTSLKTLDALNEVLRLVDEHGLKVVLIIAIDDRHYERLVSLVKVAQRGRSWRKQHIEDVKNAKAAKN